MVNKGRRVRGVLRIGLSAAVAVPALAWAALPWPVAYRWSDPAATAVMRYRIEQAAREGESLELRQVWVPLEKISPNVVRAVIAAEDARFSDHGGVDWVALSEELRYRGQPRFSWNDPDDLRAVVEAGRYYVTHRAEVRGRSTITQQLAKNLYFTPERSLARKGAELFVARRLERFLDKDRILELYLNTVELGPGLFGVEAAAREYFDVSASHLTSFQGASLAATLPHPLTSNPASRPQQMAWRRDLILQRLRGGDRDLSPIPAAPAKIGLPDALPIDLPETSAPGLIPDGAPGDTVPSTDPGQDAEVRTDSAVQSPLPPV